MSHTIDPAASPKLIILTIVGLVCAIALLRPLIFGVLMVVVLLLALVGVLSLPWVFGLLLVLLVLYKI